MSKKEAIANCGKTKRWGINSKAVRTQFVNYCGYYNECPNCHGIEAYRRSKVIKDTLNDAELLFRAEIDEKLDWGRLRKNMNNNDINAFRVSLDDGTCVVVADKDPNMNGINFIEVSPIETAKELTQENYLFTEKRRSAVGEWNLSSRTVKEKNGFYIEILEPVFVNNTGDTLTPYYVLRGFVKKANTWAGGRVTPENAQEYLKSGINTFIALAIAIGWTLDVEKSRIVRKWFSAADISKWAVKSVTGTQKVEYFGEDEDGQQYTEDTFYDSDDQLVTIYEGIATIPDYFEEIKLAKQYENIDEDQMDEMVATYQNSPNNFTMFYDDAMVAVVEKYIASQNDEAQKAMDVPF